MVDELSKDVKCWNPAVGWDEEMSWHRAHTSGAATRVTAPVPIRTLERVNRAFKDDDLKIQTRAGSICAKP